ncbi:MAG: hypothetical protein CL554_07255 [Algoriphagus sp.]|uniref:tail fiber domain-containing protein n=1 Tax=Algoriphagus sp. TaxID=1872435 RepID=UPI000C4A6005|nr:tail fiber domain-containing protein [Algoriphagus sp.]MAL13212.1 hypothetical protein [Algoriphagus sp.]
MANVANTKLSTVLQLKNLSGSSLPTLGGSVFGDGDRVKVIGTLSASADVEGLNGDFDGQMSAGGGYAVDGDVVISSGKGLQNIASLDTTTEATIEAAIDRLNNLTSAGSSGADLDIQGPLNLQEGLKANDTLIITDQLRIQNVTRVSSSGDGRFFALDINGSEVVSDALQLSNIASLDSTTEATIEGAIDTLANLASAGTSGNDLAVKGPLDLEEGLKMNDTVVITDGQAIQNVTTVSGSGQFSMSHIDLDGTLNAGGKVTVVGVSDLDGGINVNDNVTVSAAGIVAGVTQLTASHAKITVLDVEEINSVSRTETTLEVVDKLIVAASGSASEAADGGGLQIGGIDGGDTVASFLYEHSGTQLEANIAGSTILTVKPAGADVAGALSASADISGVNADFDGQVSAGNGFAVDSDVIISSTKALQNIASLDATTEATIETAIDTLNNLTSAGASGADLAIKGPLDLEEGLKMNDTVVITDGQAIQNVTTVSGSGQFSMSHIDLDGTLNAGGKVTVVGVSDLDGGIDVNGSKFTVSTGGVVTAANNITTDGSLTVGSNKGTFDSKGALTGSNGAIFKKVSGSTGTVSFHTGDSPSTTNWMVLIKSGSSSGAANHSLNLNANADESTVLSFLDPSAGEKGNLKFSGGLMIMSSSADMSLRTSGSGGGTVGVQNLLHVSGNCNIDGDLTLPSGQTVTAGDFIALSDRGLKQDIAPMNGALEKVMQLEPVTYELKAKPGVSDLGFIAQDVAKVVPEVCAVDANGIGRGIDYGRMSAILAGAVKTQQLQIEELKTIVAKLQK